MPKAKTKVLCVDDSADLTAMLAALIGCEDDQECVGVLRSADTLVAACERLRPDVVVLDLTMPGAPPLEAIRVLKSAHPQTRVIAFSGYDDRTTVDGAIAAGAWELVSKHSDPMELIKVIRRVAAAEERS